MTAEIVKRVMQKVTERHDDEHAAEANQGVTCPQTEDYKRAADELDEWNNYSNCPKRPDRQKRIAERQKIFSRMFEWSQLKDLHHPGHEKDETKNQTSKEKSEGALKIAVHRLRKLCRIETGEASRQMRSSALR